MEKHNKIKGLYENDSAVTAIVPPQALCRALVEFSARASAGFADD